MKRLPMNDCHFCIIHPITNKLPLNNASISFIIRYYGQKKNTPELLKAISKNYKTIDRFVIIFIVTDDEIKYPFYNNLIVVRTSLKASCKAANEMVLPYIWEAVTHPFPVAIHQDKPHIGFCGQAVVYRQNLINVFTASEAVCTHFVIRDKFWGGKPHDPELVNDFTTNIQENAFILCQRGGGNFSMRFYQTLAAGRIPVLTNTDMELPFADVINWQQHIVFENNELACLQKVVNVFTSGAYLKMQQDCYDIFQAYFSEQVFFSAIIDQLHRTFMRPSQLTIASALKRRFK